MRSRTFISLSFAALSNSLTTMAMATNNRMHRPRRPRTFLITGATDGIGKHTSQKLASDGHAILIHGRKNPSDTIVTSLVQDLEARGASHVAYLQADFNDLEQVTSLANHAVAQLNSWQQQSETTLESSSPEPQIPSLDCLINNAGVFDPEPRYSVQGFDATMAINVLAPFVLTRKLLPSLIRGNDARIITTSSISQSRELPTLDSLFARRLEDGISYSYDTTPLPSYSAHAFYSYSKLGDLLFTVQLARLLSNYPIPNNIKNSCLTPSSTVLLNNMRRIQCLTMDPGTVNTKMLLSGWGPCGIPVSQANNTYKLAVSDDYAFGKVKSGSYHFGWGGSSYAESNANLARFWEKLSTCTGVRYDNLLDDCLPRDRV
jgi:NAD(P)-dependent dehydrogenase (short-subunit alcohol dehydrogenase family)